MPPNDLERPQHELADARPTLPDPVAAPSAEVIQKEIRAPRAAADEAGDGQEPQWVIVLAQAAGERRRLFGDDAQHREPYVPPKINHDGSCDCGSGAGGHAA